jgi:hypothetical protein
MTTKLKATVQDPYNMLVFAGWAMPVHLLFA